MTDQRKATDELVDLEHKVDLALKYLQNIDFTLKSLMSILSSRDVSDSKSKRPKSMPTVEAVEVGIPQVVLSDQGVTVVRQKVLYPDSSPVRLGNVEVFDLSNNLIHKAKTSHVGKWTASLPPGNYVVHIFRSAITDKPTVNVKNDITVTENDSLIELEELRIS
jgi:hypothetical protein